MAISLEDRFAIFYIDQLDINGGCVAGPAGVPAYGVQRMRHAIQFAHVARDSFGVSRGFSQRASLRKAYVDIELGLIIGNKHVLAADHEQAE